MKSYLAEESVRPTQLQSAAEWVLGGTAAGANECVRGSSPMIQNTFASCPDSQQSSKAVSKDAASESSLTTRSDVASQGGVNNSPRLISQRRTIENIFGKTNNQTRHHEAGIRENIEQLTKATSGEVNSANDATDQMPLQLKVEKGGEKFSFSQTSDINGNPYLIKKKSDELESTEHWKIATQQPDISIEKVELNNIPIDVKSEENRRRVFHNIARGRQQITSYNGVNSVLRSFKDYKYGYNKRPEVAHFPVNNHLESDGKAGLKYQAYYEMVKNKLTEIVFQSSVRVALPPLREIEHHLESIYNQLASLVVAEEYRTPGALETLKSRWNEMLVELSNKELKTKVGSGDAIVINWSSCDKPISQATSNLPFAKTKGKDKYREEMQKRKFTFVDDNFPNREDDASDDEADIGVREFHDDVEYEYGDEMNVINGVAQPPKKKAKI